MEIFSPFPQGHKLFFNFVLKLWIDGRSHAEHYSHYYYYYYYYHYYYY